MRIQRTGLVLAMAIALVACQNPAPTPVAGDPGALAGPGPGAGIIAGGAGNALPGDSEPGRGPSAPQGKALTFIGITEKDGKPLAGAEVTVLRLDTNQPVATATTFDDGSFSINFGADLPPTLPIKVVAKLNGEALGAVVAGGPLAIIAGGAGNIIAGGAGNIIAGGAGNILAGGAGNILAGGAGNILAGGAGNILAGGAGNIIAGGAGNIIAGGAGNIIAGGAGNIIAGGAGNVIAGGAGNVIAGGAGNLSGGLPPSSLASITQAGNILAGGAGNLKSGNVLSGGVGNVIVAAPASLKAAVASGIIAGGAGNIIAGGAGNIIAGGAGNIIAGGAGNYRLNQASPPTTLPAVKLSLASTAAVLILEKRVRAYAQATGLSFIQVAAIVADAVFEGLTGFLANNTALQGDDAAKRLVTTALAQGQDGLPPTVARIVASNSEGIDATIVDAAVRLGLVVLGTATATNSRPSDEVLSGYEVGNANLPPIGLPSSVGSGTGTPSTSSSPASGGGSSSAAAAAQLQPGQNPLVLPSGGVGGLGNPGLNGPGPVASAFPSNFSGFTTATNPGPAVYDAAVFVHNSKLYVAGGGSSTATATNAFQVATLASDGQPGAFTSLPNLPRAVAGGAVVVVGNKAYLVGGRDAGGSFLSNIYVADLNTTTPSFADSGFTLNSGVEGLAMLQTGPNRLVVVGGRDGAGSSKKVHSINLATNPMTVTYHGLLNNFAQLAEGIHNTGAFLMPSPYSIAMIGGVDGTNDPFGNRTELRLNTDGSPVMDNGAVSGWAIDITASHFLRQTHAAVVQDPVSSSAYFFGGRNSSGSTSSINQAAVYPWNGTDFTAATNLTDNSTASLVQARSGHSAVLFGRKVLVVGGRNATTNVPLASIELGQLP